MILSASRRTDIPCRFSEWFMKRIREGYVLTRNPMNHAQLSRISLSPEVIDCIVFWTKDAAGILPHLNELDARGYRYYFQFALTPYDTSIETGLRPKSAIEETFIVLSKCIGKERIIWRYDPILLNDDITIAYHKDQFRRLCEKLSPYCRSVTVSFIDLYAKLTTPLIRQLTDCEIDALAAMIEKTASDYSLPVYACCESFNLALYNITPASCIDKEIIQELCGAPLKLSSDKNQRSGCGCCESIDIGAYNTCINGCIYCYANNSSLTAAKRYAAHDLDSGLLFGRVNEGERVIEKKVQSNLI